MIAHRFEVGDFLLLSDPERGPSELPEWAEVRDVDPEGFYLLTDDRDPERPAEWFEVSYVDSHYGRAVAREALP